MYYSRKIPVIMVSASPNLEKLSRSAGADGYLEKPFELKYLLATLKKFLS